MNNNSRMAEFIGTAGRNKIMKIGQFTTNLTELYYQWYTDSIVGTCDDMPKEQIAEWFLKEVKNELKNIQEEE